MDKLIDPRKFPLNCLTSKMANVHSAASVTFRLNYLVFFELV
jgi:hypothetical protein